MLEPKCAVLNGGWFFTADNGYFEPLGYNIEEALEYIYKYVKDIKESE